MTSAHSIMPSANARTVGYMRRVNLQTDLADLADLIELVFSSTMDSSGRAALREMRAMSRLGPGLRILSHLNDVTAGVHLGYVWIDNDQLVGNVSIYPAQYPPDLGKTWIVANVGVHPDYQGRGIARLLMEASLKHIGDCGSAGAILQVDADNHVAIRLYQSLGFVIERTWTQWKRSASTRLPERTQINPPYIKHPRPSQWHDEWLLAQRLFSDGGLGWLRPLHRRFFRRPFWRILVDWLNFRTMERLVIRSEDDKELLASAWIETSLTSTNKLTLLIAPEYHARCTEALLHTIVKRFGNASMSLEHPTDDEETTRWLHRYRFVAQRTVINMRWDVPT